ncbi:MAG: hypothetical protein NC818_07420 [Candidatus Omnitrophica bacterium]|nr:hypothetical protein [Candidatus Omnitrophota bacterium]
MRKRLFLMLVIISLGKVLILIPSENLLYRRLRTLLVFPDWMEKARITAKFRENLAKKKVPWENIQIAQEYNILEKLEKYWKTNLFSPEELVNVFIYWTNTIIKEKETLRVYGLDFSSIIKIVDLGVGGWADVGIIADLYPQAEIVGIEKFSYPYDQAQQTLQILKLPEKKVKVIQADMTQLDGIVEANKPVDRFRIKHPGKMVGVYLVGYGENTIIGLKWMESLFRGISKRLSSQGILTITMEETESFDQRIQETAFSLSGFKIRKVSPLVYEGPHDTRGLALLGLSPWVETDYEYTADEKAIEKLLKIYENSQKIEEEFTPRIMTKLFMLVISPENTDLANFIGLRALAKDDFQDRLIEIMQTAFENFGFDKEEAWEEIKLNLKKELG